MKYLVLIIILAVVGLFIFFLFFRAPSDEEAQVKVLEKVFHDAEQQYITALRGITEPGLIPITDLEPAIRKVKLVEEQLAKVIPTLKQPAAVARARRLDQAIDEFRAKNGID